MSRPLSSPSLCHDASDQVRLLTSLLPSLHQLPFWALVSFGAYLLLRLGWNVMTFHDVPEAHKELMAEIEMAKTDLRQLGVDVD